MSIPTPPGYKPLDEAGVRSFLDGLPPIRQRLGGTPASWRVSEVGDGNLNLVFLVDGPDGSICLKQALPYVRAAGESWPMPLERTFFEHAYYRQLGDVVRGLVPEVFHYEPALFAVVMERLSPHIIMRRGLIEGRRYPDAARRIGLYIARAAFFTSDLALPLDDKFAGVAEFAANNALRRITAELVFADPFRLMERNRWTSPELDGLAAEIRADTTLKAAVARRGYQFLTDAQALIHGDLHTGSIMVTETDTRVIDPEFSVYGPIGFDLGAFLANILMAYFSQPGHATVDDDREAQRAWLLEQVPMFWDGFAAEFRRLWSGETKGDAFPKTMFSEPGDAPGFAAAQDRFIAGLFDDMVGFAACKIIRRIFGFAHNADFERIADRAKRAEAERAAVRLARVFLLEPERFRSAGDIVAAAKASKG